MTKLSPPSAERRTHVRSFHGDSFEDSYEWLREKTSDEVVAHLEAEHAYTLQQCAHLEEATEEIFAEILARTDQSDSSVPGLHHHDGVGYWYYSRMEEGKDYPISCRVPVTACPQRPVVDGPVAGEEVLLDSNTEAEGHEYFHATHLRVSPSGGQLAYMVDVLGDERYHVVCKDLTTGESQQLPMSDVLDLEWIDESSVAYVKVDEAWRPYQLWRHQLATPSEDSLIFQEDDERNWLGVSRSLDGTHLVIETASKVTSEVHLLSTDSPTAELRCVRPREEGVVYEVDLAGDDLFISHNRDCVDFSLAHASLATPGEWTEVIAGVEGVRLDGHTVYDDYLVVALRSQALTGIRVYPRSGAQLGTGRDLAFDEAVYTVLPFPEADANTTSIRVSYGSLLTPATTLEVDLATLERTVLKSVAVLPDPTRGKYNPADYVQKRVWATAEDGTQIPMSVVHRKDLVLDGTNPCHLYGYGSYEISVDPRFSIARLVELERGVVWAIAHVRGGGEMGRRWYEDGKFNAKKNTFSDFVACAQHLVDEGYTSPAHLAAEGRSAGGLLMGAVCNLAPELFRAVHAGVPFVDPLTSILMPELPLTVGEWEEWGDPFHDPKVYGYMKGYAPYENIDASRSYPAILATTSFNDTRVLYVEPAKWIAELRHRLPDDGRDRLLHIEMVAGHGGVSGRYGSWRQDAFEIAWLLDQISGS